MLMYVGFIVLLWFLKWLLEIVKCHWYWYGDISGE